MADASYQTKNYEEQGGDTWVVGGKLVLDGGTLDLGATVSATIDGSGNIIISGLPTADPSVAGALYSASGVLTLSAG